MESARCVQISTRRGCIYYKEFSAPVNDSFHKFDELCVVRILSGSTVWQIGNETVRAQTGDLIFLSNLEFRRRMQASPDLTIAAFSFSPSFLSTLDVGDCLRCFYSRGSRFTHKITAPSLLAVYDKIGAEMRGAQAQGLLLAYTVELLTLAERFYDEQLPGALGRISCAGSPGIGAIAASLAYINSHLTEPLTVGVLAGAASMSEGHYSRLFRKFVSLTPIEYIRERRIALFLATVQAGETNILESAYASGFTSASGFYKAFSEVCGCTPSAWLKEKQP